MLKHVVMIKFREGCNAAGCGRLLAGLRQHVPAVRSASWGANTVPAAGAFDFCFVLGFDSHEDLAAYDSSDYHQLLRQEIRAIRSSSHTVDYIEVKT